MIVASLTTQDVMLTILEAEDKKKAAYILAKRYNMSIKQSLRLVDAVACQLLALDYTVNITIKHL